MSGAGPPRTGLCEPLSPNFVVGRSVPGVKVLASVGRVAAKSESGSQALRSKVLTAPRWDSIVACMRKWPNRQKWMDPEPVPKV